MSKETSSPIQSLEESPTDLLVYCIVHSDQFRSASKKLVQANVSPLWTTAVPQSLVIINDFVMSQHQQHPRK